MAKNTNRREQAPKKVKGDYKKYKITDAQEMQEFMNIKRSASVGKNKKDRMARKQNKHKGRMMDVYMADY